MNQAFRSCALRMALHAKRRLSTAFLFNDGFTGHSVGDGARRIVPLVTLAASTFGIDAAAQDAPARFVLRGSYYEYGFFGQGSTVDAFGPIEDAFVREDWEFPDGGAPDRKIISTIDLVGADGSLSVTLENEATLQAARLDGNDHGGGFTATADVYVLGPPNTPYFLQWSLGGEVTAVRGGGLGTTQAHLVGSTAVVNNGAGAQAFPVTITTGRQFEGVTSATPHPSVPGYHLASSLSFPAWGFTYQGIDFCFPPCPEPLNFRSTSVLNGDVTAGSCCPCSPELEDWNYPHSPWPTQVDNNCYNYALNRKTGGFSQPGGLPHLPDYSCPVVESAAGSDGLVPTSDPNACGAGDCVVALVVAREADNGGFSDYHWYRRNCDGSWSHKPGETTAKTTDSNGDVITDPQTAGRGVTKNNPGISLPGYTEFCGYYCVPCDFELAAPPGPSNEGSRGTPELFATLEIFSGAPNPEWAITDPAEIDLLGQMIFSGPLSDPIVERDALGYSGMSLAPVGEIPGIPEHVRVLDGIVQIIDGENLEYRTDTLGLENYLLSRAIDEGFGHLVDEPSSSLPDAPHVASVELRLQLTPNPFHPTTQVAFAAPPGDHTTVRAYDVRGRLVATLFDGIATGRDQFVTWQAAGLSSGVYSVRVESGDDVVTEKALLTR